MSAPSAARPSGPGPDSCAALITLHSEDFPMPAPTGTPPHHLTPGANFLPRRGAGAALLEGAGPRAHMSASAARLRSAVAAGRRRVQAVDPPAAAPVGRRHRHLVVDAGHGRATGAGAEGRGEQPGDAGSGF